MRVARGSEQTARSALARSAFRKKIALRATLNAHFIQRLRYAHLTFRCATRMLFRPESFAFALRALFFLASPHRVSSICCPILCAIPIAFAISARVCGPRVQCAFVHGGETSFEMLGFGVARVARRHTATVGMSMCITFGATCT